MKAFSRLLYISAAKNVNFRRYAVFYSYEVSIMVSRVLCIPHRVIGLFDVVLCVLQTQPKTLVVLVDVPHLTSAADAELEVRVECYSRYSIGFVRCADFKCFYCGISCCSLDLHPPRVLHSFQIACISCRQRTSTLVVIAECCLFPVEFATAFMQAWRICTLRKVDFRSIMFL